MALLVTSADQLLLEQIRAGDPVAWERFIDRFEGRLLAFVNSRLRDRVLSEDVVQETFIGFLTSLPNYDAGTPLQSFLFSIAAHKLTDALRRIGRRPALPLLVADEVTGEVMEPIGPARRASSLMRSREDRSVERRIIADCLRGLIHGWIQSGEFERLQCVELLFVRGWPNRDVAERLAISEQAVANHKYFVMSKLKDASARAGLSPIV